MASDMLTNLIDKDLLAAFKGQADEADVSLASVDDIKAMFA